MHRLIQDHLEEVLSGTAWPSGHPVPAHLNTCEDCREETTAMRKQNALMREWKAPEVNEPRAGFYARVLERIEARRPVSIWALFTDSLMGRRLATASLGLAMFLGVYVVSSEQAADVVSTRATVEAAVQMDPLYPSAGFGSQGFGTMLASSVSNNNDAVFVNLVSYRER